MTHDALIQIATEGRIRIITLDRPQVRNAFNEAMYDAVTDALIDARDDNAIAVVVITGAGEAFSSGADLIEMTQRNSGSFVNGTHGFPGFVDHVIDFPKPLLCAVNGLALGIGATMLALSDMVFMSLQAKVRLPFTRLGVAPEAASSVTFPRLLGRQNAMWALLSSEWLSADDCLRMGLTFAVCEPDELLPTTMRHAAVLAAKPINSLVESKRVVVEPLKAELQAARLRENEAFRVLLGGPANIESLVAFAERREPDFSTVDDSPITH
ncbi:MAG: enoyl-CoA hydratase-related protein [Ilumatobacteraceae bacterium]